MSEDIANYVEKNYALPTKLTYDGTNFYILEYTYAMSYGVYHLKSNFTIPNFSWADSPSGDNANINILQADYMDMAKRVFNFIEKNKKCPNWVLVKGMKIDVRLYIYVMAKVIRFYKNKGHLPSNVQIDYRAFVKPTPTPQKSRSEKILDEFESYFGICKYIDDALTKIRGKGYAFYFSDGYNMSETIRRVYQGKGANCYDIAEVLYHLALGMNTKYGRNYQVQYLDVWCPKSGYDHIRIRLRNGSNGEWWYRDGACVLDGGNITENWCGTSNNIIEVNPSWIMDG